MVLMNMEEKKQRSFYSLAKYPNYEIIMESQMASAGAHQAKFIEKLKKNNKYIKHQALALKIVFSFLFLFLPLLPLVTYFKIADNMGIYSINTIFFVSSFLFMIFFGMTLMYTLMFGMISTGSFMSGNAFKWLQTLPFSKESLKKIGVMTLFRNLDIPLIILIAGFPIFMLIITQDFIMFLICLIASIVNVIFSFSILLIIGEKMSFLFSESKMKSKHANIVRTVTMLGYFIIMFSTGFLLSWGINAAESLFAIFTTNDPPFILIFILSLIPFLFAPAFLVSLNTLQFQVNPFLILTTLTGFALSVVLTWALFKVAQKALRSAISTEIKIEKAEKREIQFEINPTSPIKAYMRKDLVSSTRDIQSFMFIFFPIFYPLIMILTMTGLFTTITISIEVILMIWTIILFVYLFIPIMLIVGLLNLEESGSSTLTSLPLLPRDQAKAKVLLMLSIQGLSLLITSIVLTILLKSVIVVILLLITLPIAWTLLLFMFVLKIKFFGKMKYKYIIEELNKENKILKWIAMLFSDIGLFMVILITGSILIYFFGITISLIVLAIIGLLGLALMIFIFDRMFPKAEKVSEYKTGGFLREHVNVATLVLLILYFVFLFLIPNFIIVPILFLLGLPVIWINFILFIASVGLLILLWQIIVPFGLKLPNDKENFVEHSRSIGLSNIKPLWRNLVLGFGAIVMYGFSTVLLGEIFGDYFFIENLFLIGINWFLFVFALVPGIWEEISFRGIIFNLESKKYRTTTVVLLNGIIFGLFHITNILGQNLTMTLIQVYYASCLGISFAYMYSKTRSLLPCILTHYLIDSLGQIFLTNTLLFPTITIDTNLVLFLILGVGVLPMILQIIMVKLIVNKKREYIKRTAYGLWFVAVMTSWLLFMLLDGPINLILFTGPLSLLIITIIILIAGPILIQLFIKK